MTSNQIAYWNLKEQQRANREKERENFRSNRAREDENIRHNKADEYNSLIRALNNVFSIAAHAAGGNANIQEGLKSQAQSVFGGDSLTDAFGNLLGQIQHEGSEFFSPFKQAIGSALDNFSDRIIDKYGTNWAGKLKSGYDSVKNGINQIGDKIKSIFVGGKQSEKE